MKRIAHMLKGDARQMLRDPMLAFDLFGPLLLFAMLKFGVPFAAELLHRELGFDLTVYYGLIMSTAMLLVALIVGVMAGFMILDERDENLISYYAVTPLTRKGYLAYRLTVPVFISAAYSFLLVSASGLVELDMSRTIPLLAMLAINTPLIALFLAGFASNKVEGLALSKAAGVYALAPAVVSFVPYPWQWIGAVLPSFWAGKLVEVSAAEGAAWMAYCAAGIAVHLLALRYLYVRFVRGLD